MLLLALARLTRMPGGRVWTTEFFPWFLLVAASAISVGVAQTARAESFAPGNLRQPLRIAIEPSGGIEMAGEAPSLVATVLDLCDRIGAVVVWEGPVDQSFRGHIRAESGRAALQRLLGRRNFLMGLRTSKGGREDVAWVRVLDRGTGVARSEPTEPRLPAAGFALTEDMLKSVFGSRVASADPSADFHRLVQSVLQTSGGAEAFLGADSEIMASTLVEYPGALVALDAFLALPALDGRVSQKMKLIRDGVERRGRLRPAEIALR